MSEKALPADGIRGEVEFRNVWFTYNDEVIGEPEWILRDFSFRAAKGTTLALVGPTGAGKSSVVNILSRMYEFQTGDILLDGTDIRDFDPSSLRTKVAMVLQDVFLFSADVATNISLGDERITRETIERSAETVGSLDSTRPSQVDGDHRPRPASRASASSIRNCTS